MDDQFTQTATLSIPCNMIQVFVAWPFSGLRTERALREFVEHSLLDLVAAGSSVGGFCTIADEYLEMGGHLFGALTRTPASLPHVSLREQLILGLSKGAFLPPQHSIALCLPLKAASAVARDVHMNVASFVYTERRGKQDIPYFSSRIVGQHVYCAIASEFRQLVAQPMSVRGLDHAKEALLMRAWLLDVTL
jgi:hypothetical protein